MPTTARIAPIAVLGALLAAALAGCSAAEPTLGERLSADAQTRTELAARATEGERLIARGEAEVERGQRRVRRGESEVSEGRELIERGERLVREAERGARASAANAGV